MTKLAFWGGIGKIGGSKISVEAANGSAALMDFGKDFAIDANFLDEFMKLKKWNQIYALMELKGLPLPNGILNGIYRED